MNTQVQTEAAEARLDQYDSVDEAIFHVAVFAPDTLDDEPHPVPGLWSDESTEQEAIDEARDIHDEYPHLRVVVKPRINRELHEATFTLDAE